MQFEGKVAGITGVGNMYGLGFATVKKLLEKGCKCFIVEINQDQLDDMVKELSQYGEVAGYLCDVSDENQVRAMMDQVEQRYGRIDFYVNNAGICLDRSIEEMTVEEWDRTLAINLRSIFISAKIVAPLINPGGSIVNAASFTTLMPTAGLAAYSASKAAVLSLTQVMAAELAKKKIRVNAYVPGLMDTLMNKERIATIPDRLRSQIACHEFGRPEDIANAVCFLVSDEASYVNGTYINVSGGKYCTQNPNWAYL